MCIEPLVCYCCFSCSLVSSPSQFSQDGVHCSCISHVARTTLSAGPTTSVPTLADPSSVCSLLLPAFLLPAKLLPLIPQLLLFFSLLLCSFSTFSLLSPAASGWFHSLFSWTMGLCCSLPSRILSLPHLLEYLLSGSSWLRSLSSYPFWRVTPGRHVL